MVDATASIEQNRLTWIRNNQNQIRADIYQGPEDYLAAGLDGAVDGDARRRSGGGRRNRIGFGVSDDASLFHRCM